MLTKEEKFNVLVYTVIGVVVGVALSLLFVYMTKNPVYWVFVPVAIMVIFLQGFVRTKNDLD